MLQEHSLGDPEATDGGAGLEQRITRLEDRLAAVESALATAEPGAVSPETYGFRVDSAPASRLGASPADPREAMLNAGFTAVRADYLATRLEELRYRALERSYARRRGDGAPVTEPESGDPLQTLRQELSNEEFDRLLLALGQPNRVVIEGVLATSPAEQMDLRAGDVIYAYGGQRVYTLRDLRRGTFGSDIAERIAMEIIRDGAPLTLYVPGGPLGVSVRAEREET